MITEKTYPTLQSKQEVIYSIRDHLVSTKESVLEFRPRSHDTELIRLILNEILFYSKKFIACIFHRNGY